MQKHTSKGIPQDSKLGPLFFFVYLNRLPVKFNQDLKCILFADDKTLIARTGCKQNNHTLITETLDKARYQRMQISKITYYSNKNKTINFTPNNTTPILNFFSTPSLEEIIIVRRLSWNIIDSLLFSLSLRYGIVMFGSALPQTLNTFSSCRKEQWEPYLD